MKVLKELIVFPLVYPELYEEVGIKPCRGVLFHGPPGTGKTHLVRCIAGEVRKQYSGPFSLFVRKGGDLRRLY